MSDLFSLASKMSELSAEGGLPPVEKWNPAYCGEIDIVIRADGHWFHEGTPIGRPQLVRLFSTVLRREEDEYFLVTPVEKMKITVEDVPFIVVSLDSVHAGQSRQIISMRTNVGDVVELNTDHRLSFKEKADAHELVPYVHIRKDLEAKLSRPVYYELAEYVDGTPPAILSHNILFPFGIFEESVAKL